MTGEKRVCCYHLHTDCNLIKRVRGRVNMMEQKKVTRLNILFEKVVADNANIIERRELSVLYQEYINDGRETPPSVRASKQYSRAIA
jgi:hypothetical protein